MHIAPIDWWNWLQVTTVTQATTLNLSHNKQLSLQDLAIDKRSSLLLNNVKYTRVYFVWEQVLLKIILESS